MKVPPEFDRWLKANALTVVPVAAKELLDGAIDLRLELDYVSWQLRELVGRESPTPLGDLLRLRDHERNLLLDVHYAAEELITALQTNTDTSDRYRAWRQAVGVYQRRNAA